MIRAAKSVDAFALADLLEQTYARSRYMGKVGFNHDIARKLFAMAAQRHGGTNDGATFLMVAEDSAGEIDAFMLGSLSRIYMVGEMLAASDVFLIGRQHCDPRAMSQLIDAYLAWADANPKVFEIGLSWADTVPGHERVTLGFERRGFALCGKTYRRETRIAQELAA
jgi:hypothetical protein